MIIIGIDPGATGAAVALDIANNELDCFDMKGGWRLANLWLKAKAHDGPYKVQAVIETVPTQWSGGNSNAAALSKLARSAGAWEALCDVSGISHGEVHPSTWKATFGLLRSEKDAARKAAQELLPWAADQFAYKKDGGRADAALIALWWARHLKLGL